MPSLSLNTPHQLGQEEAANRLKTFFEKLKARHGDKVSNLKEEWQGNLLKYSFTTFGFNIKGDLAVEPDAVERGLVGEIVARFERKGLTLAALELRTADTALAEAHYGEHADKPFFADLVDFITGGPLVAAVIEGPDAIVQWRNMMGATNPVNAAQGTIRGDLATEMQNNVTHGSDSPQSAAREVALFFPGLA